MQAEISISYKSAREAEAVAKAVSPDNVKTPPGLHIKTLGKGKKVFTQITCKTKLKTFMATIDDLMSAVSVAEKTLSSVQDS